VIYDPKLAKRGVWYNALAYCSYLSLENWDCGEPCEKNGNLKMIRQIREPGETFFGIAGYEMVDDQIILAFRGSNGADLDNWLANFHVTQTIYPPNNKSEVHQGFFNAYEHIKDEVRTSIAEIREWHPKSTIFVTGYSLGASLALLGALDLQAYFNLTEKDITLYTFGQARVGDRKFS
jgi:hypothetical protein